MSLVMDLITRLRKETEMAKNTYFATDGSYGDAEGLVLLDTSEWSDEKWEEVNQMTDVERYSFADKELVYIAKVIV